MTPGSGYCRFVEHMQKQVSLCYTCQCASGKFSTHDIRCIVAMVIWTTGCDADVVNDGSRHVNDVLPVDYMCAHVSREAVTALERCHARLPDSATLWF